MAPRIDDPRQTELRLFGPPPAPLKLAGSLNCGQSLRQALAQAMKEAPVNRPEIAALMTLSLFGEDGDEEITLSQLNQWTAASKGGWRFPLGYLPALVDATGAVWLADWVAQRCGCRALRGEQAVLVEMSAKEVLARKATAEAKRLLREVEGLRAQVTPELLQGLNRPEAEQ